MKYENGKANEKQIVQGNKYRFTILSECLIRLEYSENGIFYDNPTQFAINRNFPEFEYQLKQDDKFLEIKTKYFTLNYTKDKNFDAGKLIPMANLKVDLNGTDKSWYVNHAEAKNLKGLYISEDGPVKNQELTKGLYSLDGFVSFNDSNTMLYNEDGRLINRDTKYLDIYLFVYGKDYQEALKSYFMLTGYPTLIPKYVLGTWWSRDLTYNEQDILDLVQEFEKIQVPLSVLILDKDWHIRKIGEKEYETGYTFNKELFSNPEELIKTLHEKNIHVGVDIDPIEGINPHEEKYSDVVNAFNLPDGKNIIFDPENQTTLKAINKFLINPLYEKGVDFISNDYKNFENSNQLWLFNNAIFEGMDEEKRKFFLGRNSLIAPHRFPVTYTGKTFNDWNMLNKIPYMNMQAANNGVSFLSYDITGNHGGIEEEELYIRAIELGTFSPIFRFSAPRGKYYRKEPWRWNIRTTQVAGNYMRLRQSLIPYIYNESYKYHTEGRTLIKPLYYDVPFVIDDDNFKNQYYFGSEFLVCPILNKKDNLINRTVHKFYIPEGTWYDYKTGKKFPGNKEYISFFKEEDYPVFVKSGTIIPTSIDTSNDMNNPTKIEVQVFPGRSNNYTLYEDDGLTNNYKEGKYLKTNYEYNYMPNNYTVIIRSIEGEKDIVPEYRDYKVRFRNVKKADDVIVYFNDMLLKPTTYKDDADFVVELNHVPSIGQLTINCKGKDIEIDAVRLINDDIDSILLDLNINTILKEKISAIMFSNLAIKRKRIEIRKLDKFGLSKQYIKLFLKLLEYIDQI